MNCIKDIHLASQGENNIAWAEKNMGALLEIRNQFQKHKPLKNIRIGMALHVTKETAVLIQTLRAGGATVAIAGCNPLSTQDDVAAALAKKGVQVFAFKGESKTDYYRFLHKVIACKPHITIDDGCDLVTLIHRRYPKLISSIMGGCEETTTGVLRLHAMAHAKALKYPIIAVNDNKTKHLMDNYYGTGQSTIDGILRATNIMFAGRTVVVIGYGSCGKGIALRSKGLGANVIVTEVSSFAALQAVMDGFRVMPMREACLYGDIFITVTGNIDVITLDHIKNMKNGSVLCNSGHFNVEIDVGGLKRYALKRKKIRPFMEEYVLPRRKTVYLLGEGRLINLVAAEGHPSDVMSLSFCGQALACAYLVRHKGKLSNTVISLPPWIDEKIARLQLKHLGVRIDYLSRDQQEYLSNWKQGT